MDTFRYKSKKEAGAMAGKYISDLIRAAKGKPTLVLLSGGSAFEAADCIDPEVLGKSATVTMLDERYSKDPSINNFAQLTNRPIYKKARARGVQFIDTQIQEEIIDKEEVAETMKELRTRYEKALRTWKNTYPKGRVIALLGIGNDGHTAGIMPYPMQKKRFDSLFENPAQWTVAYDVKETSKKTENTSLKVDKEKLRKSPRGVRVFAGDRMPFRGSSPLFRGPDSLWGATKSLWSSRLSAAGGLFPLRITTTFPFLREEVDYTVVYVVGRGKRAVFERVVMERKRVWEMPARIIHQMKNITLFTDIS